MKPLLFYTSILLIHSIHCQQQWQNPNQQGSAAWQGGVPTPQPQGQNAWQAGSPQGQGAVQGGVEPANIPGQPQPGDSFANAFPQGQDNSGIPQGSDPSQPNGVPQVPATPVPQGGAQQGPVNNDDDDDGGDDDGGQWSWNKLFNWFNSNNDDNDYDNDYYDNDLPSNTNNSANTTESGNNIKTQPTTSYPQGAGGIWNTPTGRPTTANGQQNEVQGNDWWNSGLWNPFGQTTKGPVSQPSPTTPSPWSWQNQNQQQQQNNMWPQEQVPTIAAVSGQQNAWQGPGANQNQGLQNWQGQWGDSASTTDQGTTAAPMTTTTDNPCSLSKVSLGNACTYVELPPSGDELQLTLQDVYESIFDEQIIDDLIIACPSGQWCLQDSRFFTPLQSDDYEFYCNYTSCLEDAALTCNTDERNAVTSALRSLCQINQQNFTDSCQMRMKMMLYVTMADLKRKQRDPQADVCGVQVASSDMCGQGDKYSCRMEAQTFSCLVDQCITEEARQIWAQIPQWQWFFWDPIFMKQICQVTNATQCENILPTPAPQRYVFFIQLDNMDGRVMTGLITALCISLIGFIAAVWACARKLGAGYTRDRVQYTEVKPEYFDTV